MGGVDFMCREMEEIYNEGAKRADERGKSSGLQKGLPLAR